MTDTGQKILQKIKEENIHPHPKWRFIFRRSVIWGFFSLSILLGSIAGGIAMFQLRHAEWELYRHLSHSLLEFVLLVIPIFWLLFILGFTAFAYYYFRRTQQGYRYRTLWIVSGSIILSVIGGGILLSTGLPQKLESVFMDKVPLYREWQARKQRIWMSPKQGLLAGKIVKVISERKLRVEDFQGNHWEVHIADTIWRGRLSPTRNLEIKILGSAGGQKNGVGRFVADEIRPWHGKRHGMHSLNDKPEHRRKYMKSK